MWAYRVVRILPPGTDHDAVVRELERRADVLEVFRSDHGEGATALVAIVLPQQPLSNEVGLFLAETPDAVVGNATVVWCDDALLLHAREGLEGVRWHEAHLRSRGEAAAKARLAGRGN